MRNDFLQGKMWKCIVRQSVPLLLAQLVHLLYNMVDRIYLGHLSGIGSMALTGVGLIFPLTTLVAAFTNLVATGASPLFSIAAGGGDDDRAEKLLGQAVMSLLLWAVVLTAVGYAFRRPILYLFGASDASYVYADEYLRIYLAGTVFTMLATGLNPFINAQGYPKLGMLTVMVGAVLNLILDPIFIFLLHMNVAGAALATVLSQIASAVFVAIFFFGGKTRYRIRTAYLKPDLGLQKDIAALGFTGFLMQGTNCLTQVLCNVTLRAWGGDTYVGIMTVLNSVREILFLPAMSVTNGSQPVLSYNYGAGRFTRIREGIRFSAIVSAIYMMAAWIFVAAVPRLLMGIFTDDAAMISQGIPALQVYFMGFVFMAGQAAGQTTFTALKCPKRAICFSLLRKVVIVAPLTVLLPKLGLGVMGVFAAEPISNVVGGIACFTIMYFTLYRKLPKEDRLTENAPI